MNTIIKVPELSVVTLIGASGSGKSTLAKRLFKATEILSSDFCRGLVSDDENNQSASDDAFDLLYYIASKRLAAGKLVVIDATNVQQEARKPIVNLARKYHCIPVAIVLNLPEKICHARNQNRPDRDFGAHVVRGHCRQLKPSLRSLKKEGFRHIFVLELEDASQTATLQKVPLWNNKKEECGPFDIIGDIHGCFDELIKLLRELGYKLDKEKPTAGNSGFEITPPTGRKAIFLGDLVDRGPKTPDVLKLVMKMVEQGIAYCVPGNHDIKLMRKLRGKNVQLNHGLLDSITQLEQESEDFPGDVEKFIDGLISIMFLITGSSSQLTRASVRTIRGVVPEKLGSSHCMAKLPGKLTNLGSR